MSHTSARAKVAELVAGAHRDLVHAGVRTQQSLADRAGRSGLFAVLDADSQPDSVVRMTPCADGNLFRRDWDIAVRHEASGGVAEEAASDRNAEMMGAILLALQQRHLWEDHLYTLVPSTWTALVPEFGIDSNPVAWISRLRIRVQYYA